MTNLQTLTDRYRALKADLRNADLKGTFNLAASLRRFLAEPITVERAQEEIKALLESREERFLELARARIYERPGSPYFKLLRRAGCEYADLEENVRRHGLEPILERLAGEGVYFTADEAKGKKDVVRGEQTFRVAPKDLENSGSSPGFVTESSGTSNAPLRSASSLSLLMTAALNKSMFFSAHELYSYSHAVYDAILPSGGGIRNILLNAKTGVSTDRWFARTIPHDTAVASCYHYLVTYLIVVCGKLFSPGFPRPEFAAAEEVGRILDWIIENKRRGKLSCIATAASNAVRIARTAWETGASLEGTKFLANGEPLTEGKRELIERVGATSISAYGFEDLGFRAGYGCANPVYTDELHVNRHMLALILHPNPLVCDDAATHPLLFTSLHASAPRFFLNVANGDYATLATRDCGCLLEKIGFTLHIHGVRSYEKFTSEGMNYFYGDLFELFEKILPFEFGGGPGDYQLVEEEDESGQTRLTLLVHPQLGPLDEDRLLARLKDELARDAKGSRFMTNVWERAGTFRVRRQAPYLSRRGKILPLQVLR